MQGIRTKLERLERDQDGASKMAVIRAGHHSEAEIDAIARSAGIEPGGRGNLVVVICALTQDTPPRLLHVHNLSARQ